MPALSIRARLTLWYSALLTVTVLILAGAAYALLWYGSLQDMDDALQGVARALEQQAPRRGNPFVPADVDALFRRFFGFSPWDRYVQRRDLLSPPPPRRQGTPSSTLPLSAEARRNAAAGARDVRDGGRPGELSGAGCSPNRCSPGDGYATSSRWACRRRICTPPGAVSCG